MDSWLSSQKLFFFLVIFKTQDTDRVQWTWQELSYMKICEIQTTAQKVHEPKEWAVFLPIGWTLLSLGMPEGLLFLIMLWASKPLFYGKQQK